MNDYMLIYNFQKILEINKNNTMNINISSFLNKYTEIQKNDKYEPIFSSTSKYKSFPSNREFNNKLFIKNNKWKINNYKKSEFEQNLKLYINQLSFSNFDKKSNELENLLKNNISKKNINIFVKELYDKIFFEETCLTLYVSLCEKLINNNIINQTDITSYSLFLFSKKFEYISKLEHENNDDIKFKLKRQIFGTVQFISLLYINKLFENLKMINIINELLDSNNKYINESLYLIWEIIHNKHHFDNNTYKNLSIKISNNFNKISDNRLKLLFKNINCKIEENNEINNTSSLYDYIKIYKKDNNKDNLIKSLKKFDKIYVLNELIYLEFENNNMYIKILQLLSNKKELLNIINNLNIEELKIDIPNIEFNINNLKKNLNI